MAVQLIGQRAMNTVVSHHVNVMDAIFKTTEARGRRASMVLASHRDTGNAKVTTTYGDTDGFINLDDEAATSIEFGHRKKNGRIVPGLHILGSIR